MNPVIVFSWINFNIILPHTQNSPLKSNRNFFAVNPFKHKTTKTIVIPNSCSRIPLLQLMDYWTSVRPQFQLFCRSISTCQGCTFPVTRNFVTGRCLAWYFTVRIRTAECFTKSNKQFRCKVTFENEHTFCS
jgi:hypothetical protein